MLHLFSVSPCIQNGVSHCRLTIKYFRSALSFGFFFKLAITHNCTWQMNMHATSRICMLPHEYARKWRQRKAMQKPKIRSLATPKHLNQNFHRTLHAYKYACITTNQPNTAPDHNPNRTLHYWTACCSKPSTKYSCMSYVSRHIHTRQCCCAIFHTFRCH